MDALWARRESTRSVVALDAGLGRDGRQALLPTGQAKEAVLQAEPALWARSSERGRPGEIPASRPPAPPPPH